MSQNAEYPTSGHGDLLRAIGEELAVLDPTVDTDASGRLRARRAGLLRSQRRYADALADQEIAIELLGDRAGDAVRATLGHDRAVLLADLGRTEEAVAGLVEARDAFLGLRDRVGVAASSHNLGYVLHELGALDDAAEYLTEARDVFLAIDMPEEAAACDQNLGVVFYDAGRLHDAGRRFAVAHHRFSEIGAQRGAAECDANLATLLKAMGRSDEADRYRRRAESAGVGIPTAPGMSTESAAVQDAATSGSASA